MKVSWYETKRFIVVASLVLYAMIGIGIKFSTGEQQEVYPFFSWYLFAEIPSVESTYTIAIVSYDGRTYTPPLPFSQTASIFKQLRQSPTEYTQLIFSLGEALESNNEGLAAQKEAEFQEIFLGMPATYEVLYVTYDPIAYWKTGAYTTESLVATVRTSS